MFVLCVNLVRIIGYGCDIVTPADERVRNSKHKLQPVDLHQLSTLPYVLLS